MGARRCFGVILDAESRELAMAQASDRVVVEIPVSNFELGRERIGVHGKAVILGGNRDGTIVHAFDRMVCTAMPELQLEGFTAESESENLVPQANAKNGNFAKQFADGAVSVSKGSWVAGTIGEQDAVGLESKDIGSCGRGGDPMNCTSVLPQKAEDITFDSKIEDNDFVFCWRQRDKAVA